MVKRHNISYLGIVWLALIFLLAISACQTLPDRKPIEKDGQIYGLTEGAFRHNWWNYYERALSYADGGFWEEAELDLRKAIALRSSDQRRARTYGMHFLDYFPHRELGIVLYNKKMLDQALQELDASIKMERSAKASIYLDRVRKTRIEERQLDKKAPEIIIKSPQQPYVTNAFSVVIEGIARDDTYVRDISVGSKALRINLSASEVPFKIEIPVKNGENRIPVMVTDLSGKSSHSVVVVKVARLGPVLRIDEPRDDAVVTGAVVQLKGYAFCETGLEEMVVNGRKILFDGSQEVTIQEQVPLRSDEKGLEITIKDRAGNITKAAIALARSGGAPAVQREAVLKDTNPPTILLRDLKPEYTTYLEQALIEGNVRDDDRVESLFINDQPVLKTAGKSIYFSHLLELKEGENIVTIRAVDRTGNARTETIKIKRDILKVRQTGSRLRVAVNQFEKTSVGADKQMSLGFEDILSSALLKRARFAVIERRNLQAVMEEQKLSMSGLVDERTALKLGKLLAADDMLLGSILERINSLEIYARLVDTETAEMIAAVDIYGEDIDIGALRSLGQGVDVRLTEELPLLEGIVLKAEGNRFAVDLGRQSQIKRGAKVIVYEVGAEVVHPVTKKVMGLDIREVGEGRVESVQDEMSFAELTGEKSGTKVLQPMLRVITR
jgi:hypothetical protein